MPPYNPQIVFDIRGEVRRKLKIAAAKREMTISRLTCKLIETLVDADLIDAILDDDA